MKNEAVIAISWHRNAIIDDIIAEESLDKYPEESADDDDELVVARYFFQKVQISSKFNYK